MEPPFYAFEVRRGASETLGVQLMTQDVLTQRLALKRLTDGATAKWTLAVPGAPVERTTGGGGLAYDDASAALFFPMGADFTAGLPADTPMRCVVFITEATGEVGIWLDGTVTARG